ncbi:MAG: O-antigen ligase family protein [Bacteroidetes bacterium]|nr:O-antigen ligase family protein [Bacteroidota bacterium]
MTNSIKTWWVYGLSILFIILNIIFIVKEFYWISLLPIALLIILLLLYSLDILLFGIVFLTPLSVNLQDLDFGVGVSLPTEPLLFGIMMVFIFRLFYENKYDFKILKHPVTIAIIFYLIWMFVTSITSEMPIVSFKYLLSRLWFIIPYYFLGIYLFKKFNNIKIFSWLYIIALLIVVVYTIYNHWLWGFEEKPAHWVMSPFYNDHTAYGAMLAFFIPVIFGFIFNKFTSKTVRIISMVIFGIFMIAIVLSYCRAAWISIFAAIGVYLILYFKINYRIVILSITVFVSLYVLFKTDIIMKLEKNKQDSSKYLTEHLQSMSNISSDASNLERINRWSSAFRMFEERPVFGWGPGTYQFVYAPFQRYKEKTIISTNTGEKGNAHSEYIGPLAEGGVLGSLLFISILITVIYTASKIYKNARNKEIKLLGLLTFLGLVTYYTHGVLNNFLDTDKASVPFWGFIAILVAIDLYHNEPEKKTETDVRVSDNNIINP